MTLIEPRFYDMYAMLMLQPSSYGGRRLLLTVASVVERTGSIRGLFMPPTNILYSGIYRRDGDVCRRDDLLFCQRRLSGHSGENVSNLCLNKFIILTIAQIFRYKMVYR